MRCMHASWPVNTLRVNKQEVETTMLSTSNNENYLEG